MREFLGQDATGAELGSYKGGFGEFLLPHCRKLYLVEAWTRGTGSWASCLDGDSRVAALIAVLDAYRAEIEAGRVEVVSETPAAFLRSLPDASLDFVVFNTVRTGDQLRAELPLARAKLRPGGRLIGTGSDPDPASRHHAVFLAVNAFVAASGAVKLIDRDRQWALALP